MHWRTLRRRELHTDELTLPRDTHQQCKSCGAFLAGRPMFNRNMVCDECGDHARMSARQRIRSLTDAGSFRETDANLVSADPLTFAGDPPYAERLASEQRATGERDAVVTGNATIHGHAISLAVLDFGFLGGSMGVVVGEKITRAADRALASGIPFVTVVGSGGARMQEGLLSLLQMAKTAAAIERVHEAGIPYLSILTNPTTGGVFASFASLGDIIVAEPQALIGFAGPRVAAQFLGRPLPPGTHTAEFQQAHGMIDAVIERPHLRSFVGAALDILSATPERATELAAQRETIAPEAAGNAWETVAAARAEGRPTTASYLARMCDHFLELRGDRLGFDDRAVLSGIGLIGGHAVAIVGTERGAADDDHRGGRLMPEGYRKAQRIMSLAARLHLPLLTLIDTPGAYAGLEAEERGLAGSIAESLARMSTLRTPTIAVIIGEGGSGGALALALADRVLIQQQAIYEVIAPEGAATILYRDAARAPDIAEQLRLTAPDVVALGVVDRVVPEPDGGAARDPDCAAMLLREAITRELAALTREPLDALLAKRERRYRQIGINAIRQAD